MGTYKDGQLADDLRRARSGEDDALEDLLGLLRPILLRYARRQVESDTECDELARDLVQESLVHIIRGLPSCQATGDPQIRAWALTILRNICIDHFRNRHTRIPTVRIEVVRDDSITDEVLEQEAVWRSDTETSRGRRITHRLLHETIRALSPSAQLLLRLRIEQGASWREIAADLHLTRSAAKRRFERLRLCLRRDILNRLGRLREADRAAVLQSLKLDR